MRFKHKIRLHFQTEKEQENNYFQSDLFIKKLETKTPEIAPENSLNNDSNGEKIVDLNGETKGVHKGENSGNISDSNDLKTAVNCDFLVGHKHIPNIIKIGIFESENVTSKPQSDLNGRVNYDPNARLQTGLRSVQC